MAAMRLIVTHDGLYGVDFNRNSDVVWCHNLEEAIPLMLNNYNHLPECSRPCRKEMERDVRDAVDHMAKTGDTVAEFGVFGSLIYTFAEVEYEF